MPQTLEPARIAQPCTLTQADFDGFAALSGDHNPIHVDPAFASGTPFGATVSHGMLLFSRLRALMAEHYPDLPLTHQTLMFPAPSYAQEALTLELTPESEDSGNGITLRTAVRKPDGRLGLQGRCVLGGERPAATPSTPSDTLAGSASTHAAGRHAGQAAHPGPATAVTQAGAPASAAPGLARFFALAVGDTARLSRRFDAADVQAWAALAGQSHAPATLPEPLIAALFSCLLGEDLPGHGTNYLKQSLDMIAPARIGEALTASVTLTRLRADKALVDLHTRCTGDDGRVLCTGNALVLFRQ